MAVSSSVFNDIPAALRLPGWYIEFDNRLAGHTGFSGKLLVLGQKLKSGSQDTGELVRVTSSDQADNLFGRGSILAEMLRAIKEVDLYTETWAIALDDAGSAVAATGKIVVSGSPSITNPQTPVSYTHLTLPTKA